MFQQLEQSHRPDSVSVVPECMRIHQNSLNYASFSLWGMENGSIIAVATAVLTVVSVFLGAKYRKWLERGRLFAELFDDIVAAAEDDKVSESNLLFSLDYDHGKG